MFVCLPPSHSLCTAFTKTQSGLPIDVSGVRSANPCLPSQGRSGWLPFSSCVSAAESRSEAAPFLPQERQQRPAFAENGCLCWQKARQERVPWRAVCCCCCCGHHIPGAGAERVRGTDGNRQCSGRLISFPCDPRLRAGVGTDMYPSRMCLLLGHPWCIVPLRFTCLAGCC